MSATKESLAIDKQNSDVESAIRAATTMTVAEFLQPLNEALKPLIGHKYNSMSEFHDEVETIIAPLLPFPFNYSTWRIKTHLSNYTDAHCFSLELESKDDKRRSDYNRAPTVVNLFYKPNFLGKEKDGEGNEIDPTPQGGEALTVSEYLYQLSMNLMDVQLSRHEAHVAACEKRLAEAKQELEEKKANREDIGANGAKAGSNFLSDKHFFRFPLK